MRSAAFIFSVLYLEAEGEEEEEEEEQSVSILHGSSIFFRFPLGFGESGERRRVPAGKLVGIRHWNGEVLLLYEDLYLFRFIRFSAHTAREVEGRRWREERAGEIRPKNYLIYTS